MRFFKRIKVQNQKLARTDSLPIYSETRNYAYLRFIFDEDWGANKIAIISRDDYVSHVPLDDKNECQIPNGFMDSPGFITVSVYAGDRRTINTISINVEKSGFMENENPFPPEPPKPHRYYVQSENITEIRSTGGVFEYYDGEWHEVSSSNGGGGTSDLLWRPYVNEYGVISWSLSVQTTPPIAVDISGPTGKSAFQIWLDEGNSGTTDDFLNSLQGKDGESAYEAWLIEGNSGTVQDFLDDLRGADGNSAYDIWLSKGNAGSEQDFLDSLKGMAGDNGLTAFESAVYGGYTGTQTQFYTDLGALNGLADAILSITGV